MNIKLSNGTVLSTILATGETRYVQGENRDTLNFIFPAEAGMEALDKAFSEANCETITVIEEVPQPDGSKARQEYIHKGYTVRAGLTLAPVEVTPATEQTPAVFENRITVSMSQRSYAENQMADMSRKINMQEECIVEMAGIVYA